MQSTEKSSDIEKKSMYKETRNLCFETFELSCLVKKNTLVLFLMLCQILISDLILP